MFNKALSTTFIFQTDHSHYNKNIKNRISKSGEVAGRSAQMSPRTLTLCLRLRPCASPSIPWLAPPHLLSQYFRQSAGHSRSPIVRPNDRSFAEIRLLMIVFVLYKNIIPIRVKSFTRHDEIDWFKVSKTVPVDFEGFSSIEILKFNLNGLFCFSDFQCLSLILFSNICP